jgi:hypothetical protein
MKGGAIYEKKNYDSAPRALSHPAYMGGDAFYRSAARRLRFDNSGLHIYVCSAAVRNIRSRSDDSKR